MNQQPWREAIRRYGRALRTPLGALRAGVIAAALVAIALALLVRPVAGPADGPQRLIAHSAPAFTLPVTQGSQLAATPYTFAPGQDRPTLLVFFNTLCVHCLSELQTAHNVALARPHLHVVYIDSPGESAQIVANYFARLLFTPPVLLDRNETVAGRYGVRYYPTLILVDGHGIVRASWLGETSAGDILAKLAGR